MLVLGRLSLRMVWPVVNVAAPFPVLATVMVQFQLPPRLAVPETLLALVAVRSGATTVTVLLQLLLVSSCSRITLLGSTEQEPPPRGLANVPIALGVAVNCTPNVPVLPPMVTDPPLAVQVRSLLVMLQLMLACPVMLVTLTMLVAP